MNLLSKLLSGTALVMIAGMLVIGCKDDPETDDTTPTPNPGTEKGITFTTTGSLTVNMSHKFKDQALLFAPQQYVTDANDTIKLTELAYYITNIELTTKQGTKVNLGNANLVRFIPPTPNAFTVNNIPAGTYTNISYLIGVDSTRNCSGAQEGDLDPNYEMFWEWNTGYIFARVKGRFSYNELPYTLDIGGTPNIMSASHALTAYSKSGTAANVHLTMDVAKVFNTPNMYNLKTDSTAIHNSTSPAIQKLRPNISGAFSLTGIN